MFLKISYVIYYNLEYAQGKLITPLFSKTKKNLNVINFKLKSKILVMGDFFEEKLYLFNIFSVTENYLDSHITNYKI